MSDPQIRVMINFDDFRHLVAGGELRVVTDEGTACICVEDIGFRLMHEAIRDTELFGNRLGQVRERQPRP